MTDVRFVMIDGGFVVFPPFESFWHFSYARSPCDWAAFGLTKIRDPQRPGDLCFAGHGTGWYQTCPNIPIIPSEAFAHDRHAMNWLAQQKKHCQGNALPGAAWCWSWGSWDCTLAASHCFQFWKKGSSSESSVISKSPTWNELDGVHVFLIDTCSVLSTLASSHSRDRVRERERKNIVEQLASRVWPESIIFDPLPLCPKMSRTGIGWNQSCNSIQCIR
jgi:hypothetical protein